MNQPDSSLSHRQHIVSEIVHGDPEIADMLFELLVLTDNATPRGAATRKDVLHDLYVLTPECFDECEKKERRLRDGVIQVTPCPESLTGSVS